MITISPINFSRQENPFPALRHNHVKNLQLLSRDGFDMNGATQSIELSAWDLESISTCVREVLNEMVVPNGLPDTAWRQGLEEGQFLVAKIGTRCIIIYDALNHIPPILLAQKKAPTEQVVWLIYQTRKTVLDDYNPEKSISFPPSTRRSPKTAIF